ncbi:methyl-accepting chemotaxis protein [Thalassovita mangrovi]|uniref:Methyl-accepting chemotaxis protein n=1 Tax=Thalassovita mangrovi TaxID=2692236 RepID=A0A6L8LJ25_9RHOB|nr:methyl-accepting chemotaxis protein [Thalassovita mangrovi]MYM55944.1 methyl-accepting chemotaxis protein [Thalassovita mangrovi]
MKFRYKVMAALFVVGLLPAAVVTILDLGRVNALTEDAARSELGSVHGLKKAAIEEYVLNLSKVARTLAADPTVIRAARFFDKEAQKLLVDAEIVVDDAAFDDFYAQQAENTPGAGAEDRARWQDLPPVARTLQHLYLSGNPEKIGEKHKLADAGDGSGYSRMHAQMHPFFLQVQQEFGFRDIFLLDPKEGRVVYSVAKDADFGTSMLSGPYKASNLARGARRIIEDEARDLVIVDFDPYEPSFNAQTSFILMPLQDRGRLWGILAFQLPADRLNAIVNADIKGYQTGDSFLLGRDGRLRSSPVRFGDLSIGAEISGDVFEQALAGESGIIYGLNHQGGEVIAAYGHVDIPKLDWVVLSSVETDEALAEGRAIARSAMTTLGVTGLSCLLFGLLLSAWLLRPVRALSRAFQDSVVKAMRSLREAADRSKDAAESMAAVAEQTSAQGGVVKENAIAAASNVSGAATTVEEISASIQEIASGVQRTSGLSSDAADKAQTATASLLELQKATARISDVVTFINGISAQTDLLALNAAVEAARAGEAGRGFAVVAEEVRKLAEQTSSSTEEIRREIEAVIGGVDENVKAILDISGAVETLQDQSSKISAAAQQQGKAAVALSNSMSDMSERVETVSTNITGVEAASSEAARAAADVMAQMQSVDDASSHTDTAIQDFMGRMDRL